MESPCKKQLPMKKVCKYCTIVQLGYEGSQGQLGMCTLLKLSFEYLQRISVKDCVAMD